MSIIIIVCVNIDARAKVLKRNEKNNYIIINIKSRNVSSSEIMRKL